MGKFIKNAAMLLGILLIVAGSVVYKILLDQSKEMQDSTSREGELEFSITTSTEDSIDVDVVIHAGEKTLNGVTADFTYQSSTLSPTEVKTSGVFDEFAEKSIEEDGVIRLSAYSVEGVSGQQTLATITFDKLSDEDVTLAFTDDAALVEKDSSENILQRKKSLMIGADTGNLIELPQTGKADTVGYSPAVGAYMIFSGLLVLCGYTLYKMFRPV